MSGEQLMNIFESILIVIILSLTTLVVIWVKQGKVKKAEALHAAKCGAVMLISMALTPSLILVALKFVTDKIMLAELIFLISIIGTAVTIALTSSKTTKKNSTETP